MVAFLVLIFELICSSLNSYMSSLSLFFFHGDKGITVVRSLVWGGGGQGMTNCWLVGWGSGAWRGGWRSGIIAAKANLRQVSTD